MASGAKFSQIGTDVNRASDHELLFNSQWPTVHTLRNGNKTTYITGVGDIFYTHNLGFVPAFLPYTYNIATGEFEIFRAILAVDNKNIYYYPPGGGGSTGDVSYGVCIFNIDIESNYTAPKVNPNQSTLGGDGQEYGIRIVDGGTNVKSKDMQDFKVNTSARAPLIHAVAHGLGNEPGSSPLVKDFSYTHDLPYNPMFISYIEFVGAPTRGQYLITTNFAGTATEGNKITLKDIQNDYGATIVVFKDPFDVSENTTEITI